VKIVRHQKAAARQIVPQDICLVLSDSPLADLHGVKPRPIVDLVAIIEIHVLFHRSRVDACQAPDSGGKSTIGRWAILGPQRHALAPITVETPPITIIGSWWVHKASESPFAWSLPVWRQRRGFTVFNGRVFAEGALGKHGTDEAEATKKRQKNSVQASMKLFASGLCFLLHTVIQQDF
jgi:hypothetical protein